MKRVKLNFRFFASVLMAATLIFSACSDDDEKILTLEPPTDVQLKSATISSAVFTWTQVNGAHSYTYTVLNEEGRTVRQGSVLQSEGNVATANISELLEAEWYTFKVRTNSSEAGPYSEYSPAVKFQAIDQGDFIDFGLLDHEHDGVARAFPGAEGGGMYTTGGRGGAVYIVTNTNDSGNGSFRWAVGQSGPRTVVFAVSGVIHLQSSIRINNGDLTIAGQTAPGDGICIADNSIVVNADNVIIRYLRVRMGDDTGTEDDAMWGRYHKDIIIDHCSMAWSTDECSSFYANQNFTMQWCILTESLRNSAHDKGTHGYAAIWGGVNASYHHNLLAHHDSRNPRFDGGDVYGIANNPLTNDQRTVDYRNNVVYNYSNYPAYGGEGQKINFVGNYYKWGPASSNGPGPNANGVAQGVKARTYFYILTAEKDGVTYGFPRIYMDGTNYIDAETTNAAKAAEIAASNADNWAGLVYDTNNQGNDPNAKYTALPSQVAIGTANGTPAKVSTHTSNDAYEAILAYAGADITRDEVDLRAVNDTKNRTAVSNGRGSNGSLNGYIDSHHDVGGWQDYNENTDQTVNGLFTWAQLLVDTDKDGIPDVIEDLWGLNKNDASDGSTKTLDPRGLYTNLELYLHWLVKDTVQGQVQKATYTTLD